MSTLLFWWIIKKMFKVPNEFRIRDGVMASDDSIGNKGAFKFRSINPKSHGIWLVCICSDELGWEHVSCYSYWGKERMIPSWEHMCLVKSLFWDDEDCVMQLHPPKSQYVDINPFVLHLWRPVHKEIPMPIMEMV